MSDTPYFDAYMRGERSSKPTYTIDWISLEERSELWNQWLERHRRISPHTIRQYYNRGRGFSND